jgi:hypothetical protein
VILALFHIRVPYFAFWGQHTKTHSRMRKHV